MVARWQTATPLSETNDENNKEKLDVVKEASLAQKAIRSCAQITALSAVVDWTLTVASSGWFDFTSLSGWIEFVEILWKVSFARDLFGTTRLLSSLDTIDTTDKDTSTTTSASSTKSANIVQQILTKMTGLWRRTALFVLLASMSSALGTIGHWDPHDTTMWGRAFGIPVVTLFLLFPGVNRWHAQDCGAHPADAVKKNAPPREQQAVALRATAWVTTRSMLLCAAAQFVDILLIPVVAAAEFPTKSYSTLWSLLDVITPWGLATGLLTLRGRVWNVLKELTEPNSFFQVDEQTDVDLSRAQVNFYGKVYSFFQWEVVLKLVAVVVQLPVVQDWWSNVGFSFS